MMVGLAVFTACSEQASDRPNKLTANIDHSTKQSENEVEQQLSNESIAEASLCLSRRWWQNYKQHLISQDGRVIDRSDSRLITTSEGQSYALFFALMMDDIQTFDRVLNWTQNNLAHGDLTRHLPSWLWGEKENSTWSIIDANSATDSDMWIAYALLEAGRLWQEPKYSALGELLALLIIEKETIETESFGLVLLPGAFGFTKPNNRIKLNPSYLPPMLTHYFASVLTDSRWPDIHQSSLEVILQSSYNGLAPDWWWLNDNDINLTTNTSGASSGSLLADGSLSASLQTRALSTGSYDAIRVYLWLGMLHNDYVDVDKKRSIDKARLIEHLGGMFPLVSSQGIPPEKVNVHTGTTTGLGNVSFQAALLPYISFYNLNLAKKMALTVIAKYERVDKAAYYSQSLIGFGLGWWQEWYQFSSSGSLITNRGQCAQ
jgi:endoglucanase